MRHIWKCPLHVLPFLRKLDEFSFQQRWPLYCLLIKYFIELLLLNLWKRRPFNRRYTWHVTEGTVEGWLCHVINEQLVYLSRNRLLLKEGKWSLPYNCLCKLGIEEHTEKEELSFAVCLRCFDGMERDFHESHLFSQYICY